MAATAPASPPGLAGRPAYWFPLALFGSVIALSVPLYAMHFTTSPAFTGWVAYAPLSRTVSSSSSAGGGYSSTVTAAIQPGTGLPGIAEGWYWAAVLTAGLAATGAWYRRVSRRAGPAGPGRGFLVTGLLLTTAVTVVPLLVMPRASLPGWLWLSGQWASGTFALLVVAVALGMLAYQARSRPLVIIALAYTAAALAADWPTLRSAPSALTASGGDPLRTLVSAGSQAQPAEAALLPALVLLVAAAMAVALPSRLSRKLRAG